MTDFSYEPKAGGYNFLDNEFSYWDSNLLPKPYEVLQILRSHPNSNLTEVTEKLGISDTSKQTAAKNILWIFLHESGNPDLIQKYEL